MRWISLLDQRFCFFSTDRTLDRLRASPFNGFKFLRQKKLKRLFPLYGLKLGSALGAHQFLGLRANRAAVPAEELPASRAPPCGQPGKPSDRPSADRARAVRYPTTLPLLLSLVSFWLASFSSWALLFYSQGRHLSCYIGGSLRLRFSWKSALAAQHAAFLTELKVAFLIFHDGFCSLGAKVAGVPTACLQA
jgi:hypothetical protein